MNIYPPQLPPPPQQPGGYNPFNPFGGYDPGMDYIPWLPGRTSPRFLPYLIVAGVILICSCCSFLVGVVFGIELPGVIAPSPSAAPPSEPTPESFQWRVAYPQAAHRVEHPAHSAKL